MKKIILIFILILVGFTNAQEKEKESTPSLFETLFDDSFLGNVYASLGNPIYTSDGLAIRHSLAPKLTLTQTGTELQAILDRVDSVETALNFFDATSSVQTQIDLKAPIDAPAFTDSMNLSDATPEFYMYDTDTETTGNIDTSAIIIETDGQPSISLYGADGDAGTIDWLTNDALQFSGMNIGIGTSGTINGKLWVQSSGMVVDFRNAGGSSYFRVDGSSNFVKCNEDAGDVDFLIETDNEDSAFVVNGANGNIYMEGLGSGTGTALSRVAGTDQIVEETSSMRYKTDISDWFINYKSIMRLKPRQFVWNDKSAIEGFHDYGMIAEEVAEVIPEAITYNGEGEIQSWDAKTVATYLIGVVQAQQKQIDDLTKRVEALENK